MSIKTKKEKYLVSGIERTHVWLEVLQGDDTGIRVSIPLYSKKQNEEITKILHSLEEGDVVSAVLQSPNKLPRKWIINSITKNDK